MIKNLIVVGVVNKNIKRFDHNIFFFCDTFSKVSNWLENLTNLFIYDIKRYK